MTDTLSDGLSTQRLPLIDVARGGALVAMAIYHFTWDLEFFGYVERGTTAIGGWKLFARLIAGSFLFLVGVSLVLGHGRGIRWRSFGKRFAMIAVAAGLITLATYFATPDRFIFFGILHNIAVSSVFGLLFVRLPAPISLLVGLVILFSGPFITGPAFDHSLLLWLGLFTVPVMSNDFVPFFPWTGCVLLGISAAKLATDQGMVPRVADLYMNVSVQFIVGRSLPTPEMLHLIAEAYAREVIYLEDDEWWDANYQYFEQPTQGEAKGYLIDYNHKHTMMNAVLPHHSVQLTELLNLLVLARNEEGSDLLASLRKYGTILIIITWSLIVQGWRLGKSS